MSEGADLPPHTAERLYGGGTWYLPGADDQPCEGAKYHSPRPLFTRSTPLVQRRWWAEDSTEAHWVYAPSAWLCGTCRDNLSILLQMLHAADGDLEWEIRREFGNEIRALALRGWEWFSKRRPAQPGEPAQKG